MDCRNVFLDAPPDITNGRILDKKDNIHIISDIFHNISEKIFTAKTAVNQKPPNKIFDRRSGGLPVSTYQIGRSMTLRPRLTAGLPFRLYYIIAKIITNLQQSVTF